MSNIQKTSVNELAAQVKKKTDDLLGVGENKIELINDKNQTALKISRNKDGRVKIVETWMHHDYGGGVDMVEETRFEVDQNGKLIKFTIADGEWITILANSHSRFESKIAGYSDILRN